MSWTEGFRLLELSLPAEARALALAENWPALDALMGAWVRATLAPRLQELARFTHLEHMLALREGDNPEEEEGIWHDDSSRVLAFSVSLNFWELPTGGTLGIRPLGSSAGLELGPYPPGTVIVFQTGQGGFEHRTSQVLKGRRLVCAGWCS